MPERTPWCWCCQSPLPIPKSWQPDDYCLVCDAPEGTYTCPPHVCEKNDRLIPCDVPGHHS